ncbi:MAG: tetratricopeptide repeat protein [candidate division Zixibacteria bacterium]|jgi:tetratricopeptide (TPR) repeat protein|nr:tetratricopeptide repeat protein [candidate division Zixibacteria bacterium]
MFQLKVDSTRNCLHTVTRVRIQPVLLLLLFLLLPLLSSLSCISRPEYFLSQGAGYRWQGKCRNAMEMYNKALRENPEYADAYNARADCYRELGIYDSALIDYRSAIRYDSTSSWAYLGCGIVHELRQEYPSAVGAYSKAYTIDTTKVAPLERLTRSLYLMKSFDSALSVATLLVTRNPNFPGYHFNRAVVLMDMRRTDEALADLDDVEAGLHDLTVKGNEVSDIWFAWVHHARARIYHTIGDRARERAALEMTVQCSESLACDSIAGLDSIRAVLDNWSDDSDSLRAN